MEKIKNFASGLKSKFVKSDVEKLLSVALNSADPPSMKIYSDLAEKSHCQEDCKVIIRVLSENIVPGNKDLNKTLKSLLLCEALCSLSSLSFINDLKACVVKLKVLVDFYPEDKPLELTGFIRESARKVVELLTDEDFLMAERQKSALERSKLPQATQSTEPRAELALNEETKNSQNYLPPSNCWYETAKVLVAEPVAYPCPDLTSIEKMQFVRNVPESSVKTQSIFSGLKTRDQKILNEKVEKVEKVEKMENFVRIESKTDIFDSTKAKTTNLSSGNLFGVPLKAKFANSTSAKKEEPAVKEEKVNGVFDSINQKNQVSAEVNGNSSLLDLMQLQLNFDDNFKVKDLSGQSGNIIHKVQKSENSNTFKKVEEKTDFGAAKSGYNNCLFDAEFPLVFKDEVKPVEKKEVRNLEKTLINLEDLDFSLSKSVVPRRVMNNRLQ